VEHTCLWGKVTAMMPTIRSMPMTSPLCQSMLNHELAQVLYTQSQRQWFEEKWMKIRGATSERVDGAACIGPSPSDPQSPA
jgi:hypothetical protein